MDHCHFSAAVLGTFQLRLNGKPVSDGLARSTKARHFLAYLLIKRQLVPMGELYDVFWPGVKSPKNALKVLVHRVRTALQEGGVPLHVECILQRQGGYEWNPALHITMDMDAFQTCYREATSGKAGLVRQTELFERGTSLYRGRFLQSDEPWMPTARLHETYRTMVQQLITLYREQGRGAALIDLCHAALTHDPEDDGLSRELIVSLLASGQNGEALAHYHKITANGREVSGELRALYHHILETEGAAQLDIDSIRDMLEEKAPSAGAYVCDYEIFRDLYRIISRSLDRYGVRVYLGLITLWSAHGDALSPRALTRQMDLLLEAACGTLRKGDVIARFSARQ